MAEFDERAGIARIETRLGHIEERSARILAILESQDRRILEHFEDDQKFQSTTLGALHGMAGAPGMVIRVDRLEQDQTRMRWFIRAVWGAVIPLVAGAAWALLNNLQPLQ